MTRTPTPIKTTVQRMLFAFMSLVVVLLGPGGVKASAIGCPNGMSALDCQSINGNWTEWVPLSGDADCGAATPTAISSTLPNNIPPAWRNVLTAAANAKQTSVQLLAALVMDEQGNDWKDFDTKWSTSGSSAQGPFQFLPGTWDGHKQDGNNDGKMDVQNVWDAAFAAADYISKGGVKPDTPLGTLDQPMARGTLLYAAYAYNQGGGAASELPANATIDQLKAEGRNYVQNTFAVISSGFTKKGGSYSNDPVSTMKHPDDGGGGASQGNTTTTANFTSSGQSCCNNNNGQKVVVLDPGHNLSDSYVANHNKDVIDPATGLKDYDYANYPELDEVFDVTKLVSDKLTKDGYKVIMTKQSARSNANPSSDVGSFRTRANIANQAHADIAVSIHDQSGADGLPFATANNYVYVQKLGMHRDLPNGTQIKFGTPPAAGNQTVADKSAEYGQKIADARTAAEGHSVTITTADVHRNSDRFSPGNTWMVQLFSDVPWIYNEVGGKSAGQSGLSDADKQKYATGLINGIEKAVPIGGASASAATPCGGTSSIANKALELAWQTPFGVDRDADDGNGRTSPLTPKPSYTAAIHQYNPDGFNLFQGADCGVFVSTVMRASGADPKYPSSGTWIQSAYVKSSGKYDVFDNINDTNQLLPGDILIVNANGGQGSLGHTLIWVGTQPEIKVGNRILKYNQASASYRSRMANLNSMSSLDDSSGRGHYLVARLKTNAQ